MRRDARSGWGAQVVLLALAAAGCGLGVTGSMAEADAGFPERSEPDAGLEAAVSMAEAADLVKSADGAIQTDGQKDGVFDVTVSGPAIALALLLTDATRCASAARASARSPPATTFA